VDDASNKPLKQAHFWGQDPRFAVIDREHYPVLLSKYLHGTKYREELLDFDGYRAQFVALAIRREEAVLAKATDVQGEWDMQALREISEAKLKGNWFECVVGQPVARLKEV
jgi:hypothetical protein